MANLYIMVGIPYSGREEKAEEIRKEVNGIVIKSCCAKAEENVEAFAYIEEYLKNERNVIYDASNLRKKWRSKVVNHFKDIVDEIIIIYVNALLHTVIKNGKEKNKDEKGLFSKTEKEITMSYYSLQEPTEDEADKIIIVEPKN